MRRLHFVLWPLVLTLSFCLFNPRLYSQEHKLLAMKPLGEEAFQVLREFFQYDKDMPLDARIIATDDTPDYIREKIVFNGAQDSRVPGYLALPKKDVPPYPCVLLLHGTVPAAKEVFWDQRLAYGDTLIRKSLLQAGFAVLTLDAQYLGERTMLTDYVNGSMMIFRRHWKYKGMDLLVQTAVDHRRALDYLATRSEIDTSRIGALGYSGGGMTAIYLTAVDRRVKVLIPCVTALNIYGSLVPEILALWHYVRAFGDRPVLFMMSRHDPFYSVEQTEQFFSLVKGSSKQLLFFDIDGHRLPPEHAPKAVEWFQKHLRK